MIIKNYSNFIKENHKGFNTLAEYIESLAKDNEYAKQVISEFTKDMDPTIRLSNAIDLLDKHTQETILRMIEEESLGIKSDNEVEASAHTSKDINESQQLAGKNIFKCFLKVISAVGQKKCDIDFSKTPNSFLCFFLTENIDSKNLIGVLSRYAYFTDFIPKIEKTNPKLFYGIRDDMNLEYGVVLGDKFMSFGNFPLTQGTYNFIMTLDLLSSTNLKKFLVHLNIAKLNILSKIKSAMKDFYPGQSDSRIKPTINGDVVSYGFQNLGKWDNSSIDNSEIENIKNNLRSFLSQFGWSEKVQFSVMSDNGWVFINLKIK